MSKTNPKVDWYFNKPRKWQEEIAKLRKIILECGLTEELKWGCPCYMIGDKNVVLIHVFNNYCALLFFKGTLLNDSEGILVQQTKNVQSARQMRFESIHEIVEMKRLIKDYIEQAIEVEKAGLKVKFKKTAEFEMPDEFQIKLNQDPKLKAAFNKLTPGRQRGYLLYFSSAKQSKTRQGRIEKYTKHILKGKGLDD
jgi:uncharacterized protein YdeI (YjbR/CyaY-like superfamily)